MKIIAIDPGTQKAGLAVMWMGGKKKDTIMVEKHYFIKPEKSNLPLDERIAQIANIMADLVGEHRPDKVVIEWPQYRPGIKHIEKLFYFCGYLVAAASIWCKDVYLYPVGKCKGNLPKEVVAERVRDTYKVHAEEDALDAIYIGHRFLEVRPDLKD